MLSKESRAGLKHFSQMVAEDEFLRELNAKGVLIKEAEALRTTNNAKYSALVKKYNAEYRQLHLLPLRELKLLVMTVVDEIKAERNRQDSAG